MMISFDQVCAAFPSIDTLRQRSSSKWNSFAPEVIPMPIAEMDLPIAEPIADVLHNAISLSDIGYSSHNSFIRLSQALADFGYSQWSWKIDPTQMFHCCDVGVGVVETLRVIANPGDEVIICPPIYQHFYAYIQEAKNIAHQIPLIYDSKTQRWILDFTALEQAFQRGIKTMILCNPHNPVGTVHSEDELRTLIQLANKYGVFIISDEIHAPLTLPGTTFTPLLSIPEATPTSVAITSASKAWNVAGAKCASIIVSDPELYQKLKKNYPEELPFRVSVLGILAAISAYSDGREWLATTIEILDFNRFFLQELVTQKLPSLRYQPPQASYLAWLDASALDWGPDPAADILRTSQLALNPGISYGIGGEYRLRMNFACSPTLLISAVDRLVQFDNNKKSLSYSN